MKSVQWRRSIVFIVNFEIISHIDLVFPLLTLTSQITYNPNNFTFSEFFFFILTDFSKWNCWVRFPIRDMFCIIFRNMRIWSHLLKKSLMENFIFRAAIDISKVDLIRDYKGFHALKLPLTTVSNIYEWNTIYVLRSNNCSVSNILYLTFT